MNTIKTGRWYLGYGAFLIACGLLGYLSNPAAAKTALMSGGTFGLLSALWGLWMLKGGGKMAWYAAATTTLLLFAVFTWRSIVSWQAVAAGEPKLIAAALISAMWVATAASLTVLWKNR
ncbi:MAG: TMEM14 family protein [Opitutales bacterium]